jgi:hypothetical protein
MAQEHQLIQCLGMAGVDSQGALLGRFGFFRLFGLVVQQTKKVGSVVISGIDLKAFLQGLFG